MYHLRLLGGLALEQDGEALAGRSTQKRRLALLALLATAPARTMSRDKAIAILWPEKDESQGRHLLSVGVYEIRKELGEEVVESRGDDLYLDPERVSTDVEAFAAALEADDPEAAIELYAGPFLDGFYMGESEAFDHWVDRERAERATLYRQALETVAQEREGRGDGPGAVDAWSRLARADPYDSRVAERLVRAYATAGNPAGALRFAGVHVALLREELGTEPPAEFQEAVAAVRDGPQETEPPGSAAPEPEAVQAATELEAVPAATGLEAVPAAGGGPVAPGGPVTSGGPVTARTVAAAGARPTGAEGSGWPVRIVVVLALLVVGAVGSRFLVSGSGPRDASPLVAVVPMDTLDGDETDAAYTAGLAEALIATLSRTPGIRVSARSESFQVRGLSARQAARRLGADYVIVVNLRRADERLRVGVEISDAGGDLHWFQPFDRPVGDVFRTWDEIARAVLADGLELEPAEGAGYAYGGTASAAAFDAYLRGRHAWFKRTPESFFQALEYFRAAVAQDATYALAHVGLADVYNVLGAYDYGVLPPDSAYPKARAAALRALALAPDLAPAHAAYANTLFAYDRDWEGAEAAYRRALEHDPRYPETHHWYGLFLAAAGRSTEALAQAREALALDSLSPVMRTGMGRQLYFAGDLDEGLAYYRSVLALDPAFVTAQHGSGLVLLELARPEAAVEAFRTALELLGELRSPVTLGLLGHALGRAGQTEEARALLRELAEMRRAGVFVPHEFPALIRLALGDQEGAMDGLEAAFADRSGSMAFLDVEPLVAELRGHPRFEALRAKVGLPRPEEGEAG